MHQNPESFEWKESKLKVAEERQVGIPIEIGVFWGVGLNKIKTNGKWNEWNFNMNGEIIIFSLHA